MEYVRRIESGKAEFSGVGLRNACQGLPLRPDGTGFRHHARDEFPDENRDLYDMAAAEIEHNKFERTSFRKSAKSKKHKECPAA